MKEREQTLTIRRDEAPPVKGEPERQLGGPQSGFPPPFVIGQELAPFLIVGIDFGSYACRIATFIEGTVKSLRPHEYSAFVDDALGLNNRNSELGYSIKSCLANNAVVKYAGTAYSAEELTRQFFSKIKRQVETTSERLLAKAVISVPACFTHRQRESVIAAAGDTSVLGLINEPTAAALDACYSQLLPNGRYLVIASGAYSFETTVIHLQNGLVETKVIKGDASLSGDALNHVLLAAAQEHWQLPECEALLVALEVAKKGLGTHPSPSGTFTIADGRKLSRQIADEWLSDYIQRMGSLLSGLIESAKIDAKEISGIIITGEATKCWIVKDLLSKMFPQVPKYRGNVSAGAAIQAALFVRQAKDWVVWDAIANPVLVAQGDHIRQVIAANSPLPINGHANLVPLENGEITSTIFQVATDRGEHLSQVASVKIVEHLPLSETAPTVGFSIAATSNGTLVFSARQKSLDVNLTLDISKPPGLSIIDLGGTPASTQTTADPQTDEVTGEVFEPGLLLEKVRGEWVVIAVSQGSSAETAGIKVCDIVRKIDDVDLYNIQTHPREQLRGPYRMKRRIELISASLNNPYVVELTCVVPIIQYELDKLRAAIVDSTIDGDNKKLVYQLMEYSYCEGIVSDTGERQRALQAIERAVEVAGRLDEPDDTLYLFALSAKCILLIKSALISNYAAEDYDLINYTYDRINNLCHRSSSIHSAGAIALAELTRWLRSLNKLEDLSTKLAALQAHIAAIGNVS
jgi:molecular chaperone DnaK (HSP70)